MGERKRKGEKKIRRKEEGDETNLHKCHLHGQQRKDNNQRVRHFHRGKGRETE